METQFSTSVRPSAETRLVFVIGALAIAASGTVFVLAAAVGMSEAHTATLPQLRYLWMEAALGIATVAWSAAAIVLLVSGRLSMAALAVMSIGQLLLWPVASWQSTLVSMLSFPVAWGMVVVSLLAGWFLLLKAFRRAPSGA